MVYFDLDVDREGILMLLFFVYDGKIYGDGFVVVMFFLLY